MKSDNPKIFECIKEDISSFLKGDFYLLGESLAQFERQFAKASQVPFCVGVSSGTVAIQLLLRAAQIPRGSEVLVTSFCPIPTIMAILQEGLVPRFVDIDESTLMPMVLDFQKGITDRVKALIVVHIFGKVSPMKEILQFARDNSLQVIEDACQAGGSVGVDHIPGLDSVGAAMSFYPTKILGSFGDAGGILTGDQELVESLKQLRNYGLDESFQNQSIGGNYRMDDLQAMVLLEKLKYLKDYLKKGAQTAAYYRSHLPITQFQSREPGEVANEHVISFRMRNLDSREQVRELYQNLSLRASFHYEFPVYHHKGLRGYQQSPLPVVEQVCKQIINLPQETEKIDPQFLERIFHCGV